MGPKPGPDGTLQFVLPMDGAKMPAMAAEDIGRSAYGIFKAGDQFIGKHVRSRANTQRHGDGALR
jgi:hypothetical protein